MTSFVKLMKLISTPSMMLLLPYFCYIGFQFAFRTGVYGPSLTFASSFGEEDGSLTGLHGIAAHGGILVQFLHVTVIEKQFISATCIFFCRFLQRCSPFSDAA